MHPYLRDSMQFLYMKEDVGYEEFLATVYEAEMEGSEGKVVNVKAKALTVEKIIDNKEQNELKDLRQQIGLLATIMKSAAVGSLKPKVTEGVSSSRKKELLGNSQIGFQGSSRKGKGPLKPGQKPIKERVSHSGKLKLEGTGERFSFLNSWKSWLHSYTNPKSKFMIYKILKQSDLYHNPYPLYRFIGEVNETTVLVEGQEARALIDSGSQLSSISLAWVKKIKFETTTTSVYIAG